MILSSSLKSRTAEANNAAAQSLRLDLHDLGLGFVSVVGKGQEQDSEGKWIPVSEASLLVPNRGKSSFLPDMLGLCAKYDQWCILYVNKGTGKLLDRNGDVVDVDNLETSKKEHGIYHNFGIGASSFYTQLNKGNPKTGKTERAFHLESVELAIHIQNWMHGMAYNKVIKLGEMECVIRRFKPTFQPISETTF